MPEYLYPGVYVEEIETGVHPIEGVSTSTGSFATDPARLAALAADLRRAVAAHAPEWTDRNESDPGVTLVQVFAFLTENLLYRANQIPERGRSVLAQAAGAVAALIPGVDSGGAPLKRPRYFTGQILTAATLQAEQDYHREMRRRHNRALLGWGIVSGLSVQVADTGQGSGARIVVAPGYAIDINGEEISLPQAVTLTPPASVDKAYVTLRYWENPCPPVPALEGETPESPCVEEVCVIGVKPSVVAPAIALARIVRSDGHWQVDSGFNPKRVIRTV
jgi:hypothetical protein